jgi:hypothetical protein
MSNKLYSSYNGLPSWAKGTLAVGGLVIVGFVAYTIYKNAKKKSELRQANKLSQDASKEVVELGKQGIVPSYGQSQYESFVLKLVLAMDGCGTDEQSIFNVFEAMKNKADVLKLISVFGVRFYQPCAATSPISYSKWLYDNESFGGGLSTWLEYDLTNSEIQKINAILSKKSIDFKF